MTLEWKDPPQIERPPRAHGKWKAIADELRARPGEWAIVAHDVYPSMVTQIKNGYVKSMPAGEFEATSRRTAKGSEKVDVYARFVGPVTP